MDLSPARKELRDRLCVAGEYRSVLLYALLEPEWRASGSLPRRQAGEG